jgi:hypothetical protein
MLLSPEMAAFVTVVSCTLIAWYRGKEMLLISTEEL